MPFTPDELQQFFLATQALIRVEKQLRHVEGELSEVQETVEKLAMHLMGGIEEKEGEVKYGKELRPTTGKGRNRV